MPVVRRQTMGRVASLYLGSAKKSASTSVDSFMLTFTGIVTDVHGGATRAAGPREPAFRRGTMLANLRQVSLVSTEELETIASRMGLARLDPGWLAANIAITGVGPITQLPRGTIIRFPSGASLYGSDLNTLYGGREPHPQTCASDTTASIFIRSPRIGAQGPCRVRLCTGTGLLRRRNRVYVPATGASQFIAVWARTLRATGAGTRRHS